MKGEWLWMEERGCKHEWRPATQQIEATAEAGLTLEVYCFNCGDGKMASLRIIGE